MSDDTNKKPASLSTPQATANLDDVLASLEKQIDSKPTEAVTTPATPTTPIAEPIVTVPEEKVTAPDAPIMPAKPVDEVAAEPTVTPIVSPFHVEEKEFEPTLAVSAPVAEVLSTTETVKEHPQMKTDTAVPFTQPSVSTPVTPAPKVERKGFLSGFSLTPKFIGAALVVALIAIGSVGAYVAFQTPAGQVNTSPKANSNCSISYNGTTSFTVTNCGGETITHFTGPSCPTTQTKTGTEKVPDDLSHEYRPNPQAGQCEQIDHDFSGIGTNGTSGGVCACGATLKKSCGDSCVSDSDCLNPSAAGIPVVCRAGKCENAACPAGQTQPGVNCSCNAGRSCGQSCGAAVGLCTDGKSTCGFITPPNQCLANEGNLAKQFCLPLKPNNGYTTTACVGIYTVALVKPNGTTATTQADVEAACAPPAATPTPTPTLTPTPTPTMTPTPTPTSAPLVCIGIASDTPNPVVGSQVRFTCGQISGATSYEFRYKYSFAGVDQNIGTIPTNGNVSEPLVISQAATYKVQCRSCVGQSCTPWEAW